MRIAIVTDGTSDIPTELAEKFNIHIVPNILVLDGQEYVDGQSISRQEFYERLPTMQTSPTTAAPSSGTYQDVYAQIFKRGFDKILSIHAPVKLSGIFAAAHLAAQEFKDRVEVIDSGQLSLGLGFQVLAAAEAAAKGASLERIQKLVESVGSRVKLVAMLDTLDQLRRSGRVSWARASLGSLLRIKLFIEVKKGEVLRLGQARTRSSGIDRLIEMLKKLGPLENLAMLHTNAEAEARAILESLSIPLSQPPLVINVTTIIGTHVGPNALGFAAVPVQPA
jgi:DegV family protein with EDD domain